MLTYAPHCATAPWPASAAGQGTDAGERTTGVVGRAGQHTHTHTHTHTVPRQLHRQTQRQQQDQPAGANAPSAGCARHKASTGGRSRRRQCEAVRRPQGAHEQVPVRTHIGQSRPPRPIAANMTAVNRSPDQ